MRLIKFDYDFLHLRIGRKDFQLIQMEICSFHMTLGGKIDDVV